jgi:hypothetical protein
MRTKSVDLHHNFVIANRLIRQTIIHTNSRLATELPDCLVQVNGMLQRLLVLFEFQRLKIEAMRMQRTRTVEMKIIDRPNNPSFFECVFWRCAPQPSFVVSLKPMSLSIGITMADQIVGHTRSQSFDSVFAIALRRAVVARLEWLNEALSECCKRVRIRVAAALNTEATIPFLEVMGVVITVDRARGTFLVKEKPELAGLLNRPSPDFEKLVWRLRIAREIEENRDRPIRAYGTRE